MLSQKAVRSWKAIISARPSTYTILRPWNSEIGERNTPPEPIPQMNSDIPRTLTSWLIPKCSIILSEAKDHAEEIQVTLTLNDEMRITIIHLRARDMLMGSSFPSSRTHHGLSSYSLLEFTSEFGWDGEMGLGFVPGESMLGESMLEEFILGDIMCWRLYDIEELCEHNYCRINYQ